MVRALGCAFSDITHETRGTMHCVLHFKVSHKRQVVPPFVDILFCCRSASCVITLGTKGTTCSGRWVLRLAISQTSFLFLLDTSSTINIVIFTLLLICCKPSNKRMIRISRVLGSRGWKAMVPGRARQARVKRGLRASG